MLERFDWVVIGAGVFGLASAKILVDKGYRVAVVDIEDSPFQRASFVNQARIHNGYHYPRSVWTAAKSAYYFERFVNDFSFAVNGGFRHIYGIAKKGSFVDAQQFQKFSDYVGIPLRKIPTDEYFDSQLIESCFEVEEYSFDAKKIATFFYDALLERNNCSFLLGKCIIRVECLQDDFLLYFADELQIRSHGVVNATYAGLNQVANLFGFESLRLKYELTEVILTRPSGKMENTGVTVMDGPFFSCMPFGLSGYHSLTSVEYTPHYSSAIEVPHFPCQQLSAGYCTSHKLGNCNMCQVKPKTAWPQMYQLYSQYMKDNLQLEYVRSLYTVKTVLLSSEVDDSRPTLVSKASTSPAFVSVLSGKLNTLYDLEEVLL